MPHQLQSYFISAKHAIQSYQISPLLPGPAKQGYTQMARCEAPYLYEKENRLS